MNIKKHLISSYQQKFDSFKKAVITKPVQGWLKTIRELLGMTTIQFSKKLKISQPRLVYMEKNEENLKISTIKKIAEQLNCDFVYAIVPRENIKEIIYKQAKQKALKMVTKVDENMYLENQQVENNFIVEEVIDDLLNKKITKIWDDK